MPFFCRLTDKLWSSHMLDVSSEIKTNKHSSHKKTWRGLKGLLLGDKPVGRLADSSTTTRPWGQENGLEATVSLGGVGRR